MGYEPVNVLYNGFYSVPNILYVQALCYKCLLLMVSPKFTMVCVEHSWNNNKIANWLEGIILWQRVWVRVLILWGTLHRFTCDSSKI